MGNSSVIKGGLPSPRKWARADRERWLVPAAFTGVALTLLVVVTAGSFTKGACVVALAAIAFVMLLLLPIRDGIFLYFAYLLVDGAVKVNSNYNPVLHVGQDLLLAVLMFRSAQGKEGGAFEKIVCTPHIVCGLVLLLWIFIQYLNPFGLGLLPSIAGSKLYLSMICLFFLVYHHIPRRDLPVLLRWLLGLTVVEGAICVVEYLYGQSWMLGLHPRYREMSEQQFSGIYYRPFGTTAVPGGPSIWVMLGAPIAGYLLLKPARAYLDRVLALAYLAVGIPTLVFCQVRLAILTAFLGILMPFLRPARGFFVRLAVGALVVGLIGMLTMHYLNSSAGSNILAKLSPEQREHLLKRANSLGDRKTYAEARGGAYTETAQLADLTWFGIGLSRVGAASAVWSSRIQADPYFGARWGFADNLFKAMFTELGIFGLLAWLVFVFSILKNLAGKALGRFCGLDQALIWTCGLFAFLLVASGVGNEGVLYNPVSGIFWTLLAVGAKEASYASSAARAV